ncbi:MAG: c-type cytochrome [Rubrivivax sp.]|nr:c-type cytochrome [Rubrivivax sp.]
MRNSKRIGALALVWAAATTTPVAFAQPTAEDLGRLEYEGNCASCHGMTGKGDGRLKGLLTKAPSDLTTLSRRYGGAFPNQMVWEIIDGRTEVGAHGARDMPVWGQVFRRQALQYPGMANQPEWYVRGRIVALLDYLARIQTK